MKMVIAIVRPDRHQAVKDSLHEAGFNGMTITHVTGRGQQAGLKFANRFGEFVVDEIDKVKFEIVVEDEDIDKVIDTVSTAATTGHPGDGRIFVLPIERTTKISDYMKSD